MPVRGPHTVTVPGAVAGWRALHDQGAVLDWAHRVRAGASRTRGTARPWRRASRRRSPSEPTLAADPGMASVFFPGGSALTEGATFGQPALAATLDAIADGGPRRHVPGRDRAALRGRPRARRRPDRPRGLRGAPRRPPASAPRPLPRARSVRRAAELAGVRAGPDPGARRAAGHRPRPVRPRRRDPRADHGRHGRRSGPPPRRPRPHGRAPVDAARRRPPGGPRRRGPHRRRARPRRARPRATRSPSSRPTPRATPSR